MSQRPLRPHQTEALDRLRMALAAGKLSPLLQAPTGFGKTRVMAEIVSRALSKSRRVLITVPAVSLVDQTIAELEAEGILDIGVLQGAHERTNGDAAVQVASVQTLERRRMPNVDLILIDECHRWFKFFGSMMAMARLEKRPVIGFSATPWTRGLGKHFDDLIDVISTEKLIHLGFLSPFRVFAPSHPDLSQVRIVAGDFHEGDLAAVMGESDLVADVVTTWLQLAERRPTLCFAVDRAHAKKLQLEFEQAGVSSGYIDAFTPREDRAKIRHAFHAGDVKVVCNVGCMTTGIDWDVRCIVLARPTKSEMLFCQIIGRGLRTAPEKTSCLVLDHSDTHLRLGMVTDIRHDRLSNGEKGETSPRSSPRPMPKECPQCRFVKPAKVHRCPNCDFAPDRQSAVDVADGDLVELGAERRKHEASSADKAAFFAQLKGVASQRGYSSGWAANQFRERFKVWPNHYRDVPIAEPTPEVLNWVRSRMIAYAKRRKAG